MTGKVERFTFIVQADEFPLISLCSQHYALLIGVVVGLNVLWMCRVAAQRDSWHALDSQCLSPKSGRLGCGRKYERVSLSADIVCECLLCIWCSYSKLRLWVSPFTSSLITVPTGEAAQKSLSNANTVSLLAHITHRRAVSHNPFTVYFPRLRLPAPKTHNLLVLLSPRVTRQRTVNLLINASIN